MIAIRHVGLLALIAQLSSCMSPYVAPTSGSQAKLRIVSYPGTNTFLREGTNPSCISEAGRDLGILGSNANSIADRGTGRRVGIPLIEDIPPKQSTEIVIPAGKPFMVEMAAPELRGIFGVVPTYDYCRRLLIFSPGDGLAYEAVYRVERSSSGPTGCSVALFRIAIDTTGRYQRIPETGYQVFEERCK